MYCLTEDHQSHFYFLIFMFRTVFTIIYNYSIGIGFSFTIIHKQTNCKTSIFLQFPPSLCNCVQCWATRLLCSLCCDCRHLVQIQHAFCSALVFWDHMGTSRCSFSLNFSVELLSFYLCFLFSLASDKLSQLSN